jgi:hypothetical protein
MALAMLGRGDSAIHDANMAVGLGEDIQTRFGPRPRMSLELARMHVTRAMVKRKLGLLNEAQVDADRALEMLNTLDEAPTPVSVNQLRLWAYGVQGSILLKRRRIREFVDCQRRVSGLINELMERNEDDDAVHTIMDNARHGSRFTSLLSSLATWMKDRGWDDTAGDADPKK